MSFKIYKYSSPKEKYLFFDNPNYSKYQEVEKAFGGINFSDSEKQIIDNLSELISTVYFRDVDSSTSNISKLKQINRAINNICEKEEELKSNWLLPFNLIRFHDEKNQSLWTTLINNGVNCKKRTDNPDIETYVERIKNDPKEKLDCSNI